MVLDFARQASEAGPERLCPDKGPVEGGIRQGDAVAFAVLTAPGDNG